MAKMDIRQIIPTEHIEALNPLLALHREELATNKDIMVLKPDWDKYKAMESLGILFALGLYDSSKLVGYSALVVTNNLHYSDLVQAWGDVIYIRPDYRKGRWGLRLIRKTEELAKEKGAHIIFMHGKPNTVFSQLMPKLGYQVQDVIFGKQLQGGVPSESEQRLEA
jgi:GNAT superfamily N-acetyltransferase